MIPHVPDRGQIIALDFDPQVGREIGKRRPALVISPKAYNRLSGFALVCPVTTKPSTDPFEVTIGTNKTVGVVLPDRIRSVDWRARRAALIENAPPGVLDEVHAKLLTLV